MEDPEDPEITEQKRETAGVFSRGAATYDRVGPAFFSHFGRRLVELAQIPSGARVLDIATGRGAVLFPAAEAVGPQGQVTRDRPVKGNGGRDRQGDRKREI